MMMYPSLVMVLLSVVIQLFVSIPAVAGDCYDEHSDCSMCFQTLANALMDTGDNKYQLSQGFFPDNAATPVQVQIEYVPQSQYNSTVHYCKSDELFVANGSITWYWLAGEFLIHQPLHLLLYRSLFLSPPLWRRQCVVLFLPDQCLNEANDKHFMYLTQRVSY